VNDRIEDEQPGGSRKPPVLRTGSEQPIDPEDLVKLAGRDVTPERIDWARHLLEEKGAAAVELYLP
jgi:hypothetical protein